MDFTEKDTSTSYLGTPKGYPQAIKIDPWSTFRYDPTQSLTIDYQVKLTFYDPSSLLLVNMVYK